MSASLNKSAIALMATGALGAASIALLHRPSGAPQTALSSQPLSTDVYVWQRSWGPEVAAAIDQLESESPGYCALGLEIGFGAEGDIEALEFAQFDKALAARLARAGRFSVAVRVHRNPAGWTAPAIASAAEEIEVLVSDLHAADIAPTEVQIDYDCPQSKLGGYARFITALRGRLPRERITITALPSWLGESDFKTLARSAQGYVLQVHALSLPGPDSPGGVVLCDPAQAARDIERAARLGEPFRVALPTYSSLVLFDAADQVVDVVSEDLGATLPAFARAEFARSDEAELADLVRRLKAGHPTALRGIAWYRLPVRGDRMNWPMAAFRRIIRGEQPTAEAGVELRPDARTGALEVVFANRGETAVAPPPRVDVIGAPITAWEGLRGYRGRREAGTPARLVIQRPPSAPPQRPLRPGEEVVLAWLRHEGGIITASTPRP